MTNAFHEEKFEEIESRAKRGDYEKQPCRFGLPVLEYVYESEGIEYDGLKLANEIIAEVAARKGPFSLFWNKKTLYHLVDFEYHFLYQLQHGHSSRIVDQYLAMFKRLPGQKSGSEETSRNEPTIDGSTSIKTSWTGQKSNGEEPSKTEPPIDGSAPGKTSWTGWNWSPAKGSSRLDEPAVANPQGRWGSESPNKKLTAAHKQGESFKAPSGRLEPLKRETPTLNHWFEPFKSKSDYANAWWRQSEEQVPHIETESLKGKSRREALKPGSLSPENDRSGQAVGARLWSNHPEAFKPREDWGKDSSAVTGKSDLTYLDNWNYWSPAKLSR
jgi:hypothetical protein